MIPRRWSRPGSGDQAAGDQAAAHPHAPAELDEATQWALKAQDGDPIAQAAFVRLTQAEVWRFTAALVDPASADDLTQETYLRAFRALPTFAARSTVRTWLLGIARRACADHLRTVVRRRRLDERLAQLGTPDSVGDTAGQLAAVDLLRGLTDERRTAFALTQVIGLSYAEAAVIEGVPIGTIRSRVARARDDLVAAHAQAIAG